MWKKVKSVFILSILFCPLTAGQVMPPNDNFFLDSLQVFYPGNSLKNIQEKYGKPETYGQGEGGQIYRFSVPHPRYRFGVFVQIENDTSVAFWASLPTSLSHDIFHRKLIRSHGKQNLYFKKENSALFVWNDLNGTKLIYSGQCTITCFPHYLAGIGEGGTLLRKFNAPL